jgi:sterol desaturase/sphingolipid hydroxylase (fatty acid hydroxylase superfamily)
MHSSPELELILSNLKYWLPIAFALQIGGETIFLLIRFRKLYYKETFVNLATGGLSFVIQAVLKTYFLANLYPWAYEHRMFELGLGPSTWIMGFLLYTFIQFFTHLIYHKVRLFWCLHEVHHSAIHMNTSTGLRTSIFDIVSLEMCNLFIPLLGIHPIVYFILYSINKFWGSFIHINENIVGRIPFFEYILVSPSAHHIHHASNIRYLDKNYGEVVPWYDMLFKTYEWEEEKLTYGTLKVDKELGFWETQLHEIKSLIRDMRNAKGIGNKIALLFMPPGWLPGNKGITTRMLQDRLKAANES